MLFEDCRGCHVAKLAAGGKNENRVISWKATLGSRADVMKSGLELEQCKKRGMGQARGALEAVQARVDD